MEKASINDWANDWWIQTADQISIKTISRLEQNVFFSSHRAFADANKLVINYISDIQQTWRCYQTDV